MSWAELRQYLEYFRTNQIIQLLQDWDIGNISTNPWILGGFAALILITYYIGWRALAGFLSGIGGFVLVLSLAVGKGTDIHDVTGGGLWILIGGGAVVVFLFIYLLFIKSE